MCTRVLYFLVFFSLHAAAQSKIEIVDDWGNGQINGGRLWLPCTLGKCMLDTGGQGSLMALDEKTKSFDSIKSVIINSFQGPMTCDVLKPIPFVLASKSFKGQSFYRCPDFPTKNSPMLGLDFFDKGAFEINFHSQEFSWINSVENFSGQLINGDGWIAFQVSFNALVANVVFDTGAPTSIIDRSFYQQHKDDFEEISSITGVYITNKTPFVINGQIFNKKIFMVVKDIRGTFSKGFAPDIFLGMNVIRNFNWQFNFEKKLFHVE